MRQKRRLIVNKAGCGCGCNGGSESGEFQTFRINLVARNSRRVKYEGRETLVVPVVMLREAVVNGAFVAADELVPQGWNGVPVTVGHPQNSAGHVSANEPEVLTRWSIGRIFGANVSDSKLKGEAWLDIARAEKLAPGLIEALEAGEEMDVSTGYFPVEKKSQGVFNGKSYAKTHHNLIPDHLALLPNEEGACSWADGCGVRANQKVFSMKAEEFLTALANALGIKRSKLKVNTMNKEALIKKITANSKMKAADLEDMDLKALQVIANGLIVNKPAKNADEDEENEPEANADGADDEERAENEDDEEEPKKNRKGARNSKAKPSQLATLSAEDREALAFARNVTNEHRSKLIEKIVACSTIKKSELEKLPLATLETFANGLKDQPSPDYGGRSQAVTVFEKDDPAASMVPQDCGEVIRINRSKAKEAA